MSNVIDEKNLTRTNTEPMELKIASIVLVGLCNGDVYLQDLLGTIIFRENEANQLEPQLVNHFHGEEGGSPHKAELTWKSKGNYGLSFPSFAGRHGVMIILDRDENKYWFVTGNAKDSGSSGPLSNGGSELVNALDQLYYL
ncbi:MAG: hypothetical protein QG579_335 [Patescibacteria group bacterium]|jgi:hypothetical protein|nr:hypothetical protein [Patescibacteria group bacterium]